MSDGSNKLYHIAPSTFNILKEVEVYDHNGPVDQLNELEYVDGMIWANVWLTDRIVVIDPETGIVRGELNLPGLLPATDKARLDDKDDVLNGIALNALNISLPGGKIRVWASHGMPGKELFMSPGNGGRNYLKSR